MKTSVKIIVGLLCLTVIIAAFTFKPSTSIKGGSAYADAHLPIWEVSKMHTLEVAEAMPEDKYGYRPSDASKTFAEQMVHMGYATKYLVNAFIKGEQGEFKEPSADGMSKAEIKKMVEEAFDYAMETMKGMTDEDLKATFPWREGREFTKSMGFNFIRDHITNHRAKANLYIRINEMKPPAYKF